MKYIVPGRFCYCTKTISCSVQFSIFGALCKYISSPILNPPYSITLFYYNFTLFLKLLHFMTVM
nr:MAG TPA: hypothetical protein [Caudoviricetes sp.]